MPPIDFKAATRKDSYLKQVSYPGVPEYLPPTQLTTVLWTFAGLVLQSKMFTISHNYVPNKEKKIENIIVIKSIRFFETTHTHSLRTV